MVNNHVRNGKSLIVWIQIMILLHCTISSDAIFDSNGACTTTSSSSSSQQSSTSLIIGSTFRPEASIMGESALIDKETGRVFWEGRASNTLFESIEPVIKNTLFGLNHIKATLLSSVSIIAGPGHLLTKIKDRLLQLSLNEIPGSWISLTSLFHFIVKVILFLPRFDKYFILFIYIIYLFECYNFSTR
jgi:hypothetical protein